MAAATQIAPSESAAAFGGATACHDVRAAHLLELATMSVEAGLPNAAGHFISQFQACEPDDPITKAITIDLAAWRKRSSELRGSPIGTVCWGPFCSCVLPLPSPEDPEIQATTRKLCSMQIDAAFEETPLDDIVAFLRDYSGLNVLLDAAMRDKIDCDRRLTVRLRNLVLADALQLVCAEVGIVWHVTEENVVLITTQQCG